MTGVTILTPLRAALGDIAEVQGRIAKVVSINEGQRDVTFEYVGGQPCPTCGRPDRISINEGCLNWHEWVKPVPTCGSEKLHEMKGEGNA